MLWAIRLNLWTNAMSDDDKKTFHLDQYRKAKAEQGKESRAYNLLEQSREHSKIAPQVFLEAWKKGIKLVGVEFFTIKSDTIDSATDKWQLAPNFEFIQKASGGYSHSKQVLLALMYSFYDPEEGQQLLERFGTPNFVSALTLLDFESTDIIVTLWLHYTGW